MSNNQMVDVNFEFSKTKRNFGVSVAPFWTWLRYIVRSKKWHLSCNQLSKRCWCSPTKLICCLIAIHKAETWAVYSCEPPTNIHTLSGCQRCQRIWGPEQPTQMRWVQTIPRHLRDELAVATPGARCPVQRVTTLRTRIYMGLFKFIVSMTSVPVKFISQQASPLGSPLPAVIPKSPQTSEAKLAADWMLVIPYGI